MIVKTIHGKGSVVDTVEDSMIIEACNVYVEEDLTEQLDKIKMINSIIHTSNKTIYTDKHGKIYHSVSKAKKKEEPVEDFYKNEGVAIYVKGKLVVGIHPDNVENNLDALEKGDMKIGWNNLKKAYLDQI